MQTFNKIWSEIRKFCTKFTCMPYKAIYSLALGLTNPTAVKALKSVFLLAFDMIAQLMNLRFYCITFKSAEF